MSFTATNARAYIIIMYTYSRLLKDIKELRNCGAETGFIGLTECGRKIPYVKIGSGKGKRVIVTGAIHARENLTARLVTEQAKYALNCRNFNGTIYFIPMVNPDGAVLVESGADAFGDMRKELIALNDGSTDFSLWKANVSGVDLNVNFDARWGMGRQNVWTAGKENYVGAKPFSAAETAALRDFTLKVMPDCTISYHAKGQELYWFFHQFEPAKTRDRRMAEFLNRKLGYLLGTDFTDSAGGYKDWCIEKLNIPAFTLEIISDSFRHPLSDEALTQEEINKNIDLPVLVTEYLKWITKST